MCGIAGPDTGDRVAPISRAGRLRSCRRRCAVLQETACVSVCGCVAAGRRCASTQRRRWPHDGGGSRREGTAGLVGPPLPGPGPRETRSLGPGSNRAVRPEHARAAAWLGCCRTTRRARAWIPVLGSVESCGRPGGPARLGHRRRQTAGRTR